jgi:hypothetical protein
MSKRAERRHHSRRMKAKAKRIYWQSPLAEYFGDPSPMIKTADYLQSCSCPMCGNPRKWFQEKTIQELKSDLDLRDFDL